VHVVNQLRLGGMENGLVNLINRTPPGRMRHAVLCMEDYSDFRARIADPGVPVHALHKRPGRGVAHMVAAWRWLRQVKPDVVHTRGIGGLDAAVPAILAGVRARVHSEHGWDARDLRGANARHRAYRRVVASGVQAFVGVSDDLTRWLIEDIGLPAARVRTIHNGVDTERFAPAPRRAALPVAGFADDAGIVIGAVGRMQPVKNPLGLVRAFIALAAQHPDRRLRLAMIGGGPLHGEAVRLIAEAGLSERVWLPGDRDDVPELMRALDVFVLPSLNEGTSNTLLEAMSTGLPVVATPVGGNVNIVADGVTGLLSRSPAPEDLAQSIGQLVADADARRDLGRRARDWVYEHRSLAGMVDEYLAMYESLVTGEGG
jgi:sugar transferase (PEP-CTERM/EpsH1 system associated)